MKQLAGWGAVVGGENVENTPLCYEARNCNIETAEAVKDTPKAGALPFSVLFRVRAF